ncbi:MAG TPA: energy transducer TonB [Xanthomonadales bacterium]|nr:energy transducer TonB [Xanthomonadales bacterium]
MVQVHATKHAFQRPDATRIAALSGAMALNFGALLLLLIPITMPTSPPQQAIDDVLTLVWPEVKPPEEIKPIPPMPEPPPVHHRERVREPVVEQTPEVPPVEDPVIAEPWTPPVPPGPVTEPAGPVDTGPVDVGSSLASINPTPPRYPIRALRQGIEGTVELRILVGANGLPIRVDIGKGSGNRELDNEARRHVLKKWRFQPQVRNGVPVQAWGTVSVVFSLNQG